MTTDGERQSAEFYAKELCGALQVWGLKREQARAIAKEMIRLTRSRDYEWKRMRNHAETLDLMRQMAETPEDHARIAELAAMPVIDPWRMTDNYVKQFGEQPFQDDNRSIDGVKK